METKTRLNELTELYHPDIDISPNGYNHYGKVDFGHSLAEAIVNPNSLIEDSFKSTYSENMTVSEAREEALSRIRKRLDDSLD